MTKLQDIIPFDTRNYGHPPEPTAKSPFAQVEWIFDKRTARALSQSSKNNYQAAKRFYIAHLEATEERVPFFLAERWDEFALLRFKDRLQSRIDVGEIQLSSYTLTGHFSALRQVIQEAVTYRLLATSSIQGSTWGSSSSETDAHRSYSDNELSQILAAVGEELQFSYAVARGYRRQPANLGRDPRLHPTRGRVRGYGHAIEANMRWYFENELSSTPIVREKDFTGGKAHLRFLDAATVYHGGLHEMYRRWGVSAYINENLIMPLVVNFLHLTGLNPTSLLELKTDCFRDEHPLTGMPYLLFRKERSGGEKELHLPLLEKREERALKRKQTLQVKRAIEVILTLTAAIRSRLANNSPLKQHLFIYESDGQRCQRQIMALTSKQTSAWCQRICSKHNLVSDNGSRLSFNLVRFRSTKLTEMALEGRDLFEIQQVARHKSIAQTVRYISANRLDAPARKVVAEALEQIQANQREFASIPTEESAQAARPIHLFKGVISNCKNVFDPPDLVKRTVDYVAGQACTRFNMCLFCRNVVILKEHLPRLVAYRTQILAIKANNIQNLPHAHLYDQTLSVLDNLLDPSVSQFTLEEIQWASDLAPDVDIVIDPLLYRGTCQ